MSQSTTPQIQEAQLDALQVLRGLAALAVVLMHFKEPMARFSPGLASWAQYGYVGVDVFFLISGFIIYHATRAERARQAVPFLVRRLCRVVLPAWFAMALLVALKPPYLIDLVRGLLFLPRETGNPPYLGHAFLIVAWTLTFELVFYGVFAAALTTAWGRARRGLLAAGLLVAIMLAGQALAGHFTLDAEGTLPVGRSTTVKEFSLWPLATLLSSPMLLEFVLGIGLAASFATAGFRRWAGGVAVLGLGLAAAGLWQPGLSGHGLTRSGIFALGVMLVTLAAQAALDQRRRPWPALGGGLLKAGVWLGGCSYSLYLVHPLVKTLTNSWSTRLDGAALAGLTLAAVLASVAAAGVMHRWIELPAQRLGKRLAQWWGGAGEVTRASPAHAGAATAPASSGSTPSRRSSRRAP